MNKEKINTAGLEIDTLIKHIDDFHDGNILYLISNLDHAIYLFHFLHKDSFSGTEIRRTTLVLKHLRECFMKAYLKQQGWSYHTFI